MLKFIRRNAGAAWVKFIFVAIVVVFVFWGMGGIVGGEKATIVAKVNGETIDPIEFDRAYDSLRRLYQDLYKDSFKPELLKMLDLKGRAVDQLIQVSLLDQEAKRIGLQVSEVELRDAIAGLAAFKVDGHFSKEMYVRALRANGLSPGEFEDAERQELLVKKMEELIGAGVHVREAEVHDRYLYDNQKVNLRYVKLDAANFTSQAQVADADVQTYFDANKAQFREPERVRMEYLLYAADSFTEKAEAPDAEVQHYYDAHAADFEKPEQVRARHILFTYTPDGGDDMKAAVHKKAEEVLAKAKAGEDFAGLAKQYSEDSTNAANGGDLGVFGHGKMLKPFEDAAFALAPGEISDVVESPLSFHIIKVETKEPAHTQRLEDVRAEIVTIVKKEKAKDLARAQAEADRTKAEGGEPLANIAQMDGLTVATIPPFAETDAIVGIGRNPELTKAAFAASLNGVGPIIDTPKGLCVFRVTEKIATYIPELAQIHDRVESKVRAEKAQVLAKSKAEAMLATLQQRPDLDAAAAADGLKVEETGTFGRQGPLLSNLGSAPDLKKVAFQLTPEKPVAPAVYAISGSSIVAVLKERVPADEEKFKTDKANLIKQAEDRRKGQAMEEFINYLKARATIQINQDFLASVTDNGRPLDGGRRRAR